MKPGINGVAVVAAAALLAAFPVAAQQGSSANAAASFVSKTDVPRFRESGKVQTPARGQQIFVEYCALCHGMTGKGDGPRSAYFQPGVQFIPDFSTPGYLTGRDEQVLNGIREGLKRLPEPAIVMPQFKYILADSEIRSVFAYVKTLAVKPQASAATPGALIADGEALAKKYNCLACHQVGSKVVGPAYRDVAAKYKGQAGAAALLIEKVKKGSTGVWGVTSMPPKADVPDAELRSIVDWILKTG